MDLMIIKKNSSIGIWGFGVVGKSVVNYLHTQGYDTISIMDKRVPTQEESDYLKAHNIRWYNESEQEPFFNSCEIIIPSPGINISATRYATRKIPFIHELDIFYNNFNKPIIAVTGSIGKTSTVHILGKLLQELTIPAVVGGNIGIPMLNFIALQNDVDYALLEVSSFQLLHCTDFAPQLAILTNLYPNHLDHHATEEEYFSAKYNLFRYQKENSISLLPFALRSQAPIAPSKHLRAYFILNKPQSNELEQLTANERVYYIENNTVIRYTNALHTPIMTLTPELLNLSFVDNILLLASVCDLMHFDNKALQKIASTITLPEHRIEKIGTLNNIEFYNDSKATTTASTYAAVQKLHHRPLHLFIGGLSKGVDRAPFIAQLNNKVKHIYCFGREAEALYTMCISNNIPATHHTTLDDAVNASLAAIVPGDCVLLSPAGSSYDLYENYEERGKHFKKLITDYIHKHNTDTKLT
jgi:UDP-N-acetylmuramoylalanine--D-glutamate ligase